MIENQADEKNENMRFEELKKILGHPSDVTGLKKCLVCLKLFLDSEYQPHVSTHLKEPLLEVEKIGSSEWLEKNDGLIIKSSRLIVDPLEKLDVNLKTQLDEFLAKQPKELKEKDLMKLLNQDFDQQLHKFYILPGRKLHKNLRYNLTPDPRPFTLP